MNTLMKRKITGNARVPRKARADKKHHPRRGIEPAVMSDDAAALRARLSLAIKRMPRERMESLRGQILGVSGKKALIAIASGMPKQSSLSDIGKPGKPMYKHRERLASVLGVSLAWLEGTGGEAPDWELHPIDAWRRYADRLRRAAQSINDSMTFDADEEKRFRKIKDEYATRFGVDLYSDEPAALAAGRFDEVPFELVLRHARACGMKDPDHVKHVARGHAEWVALRASVVEEVNAAKGRLMQYFPPKALFAFIRNAILAYRDAQPEARRNLSQDALEILWRQQWRAIGRTRDDPIPILAQCDTGNGEWCTLRSIRGEYMDESIYGDYVREMLGKTLDEGVTPVGGGP